MLEALGAVPVSPVAGARAHAGPEPLANICCNKLIHFYNSFHFREPQDTPQQITLLISRIKALRAKTSHYLGRCAI